MLKSKLLLLLVLLLGALGCHGFDAPPQVTLLGAVDGILADPTAPVVIGFHEPFDVATLQVKIVRFETDAEGNLFDEDSDPETELDIIFQTPGPDGTDVGGTSELFTEEGEQDPRFLIMKLNTTLPIGPPLALLIEPGLKDLAGNEWKVRQVIKFGFEFSCGGDDAMPTPSLFPSSTHFMLVDVDSPISVQLQLFAVMVADPETGNVIGQFTNGDRDPATDCGLSCNASEVCRTLPAPDCVPPSETAGTADEYPDFYANNSPPEGYSFTVNGCARDQEDGSFTYANAPVDVQVQSPPVTIKGIQFNGSFAYDSEGILRAAGTFTVQELYLGTTPSGPANGSIVMRQIPDDEVKDGTPGPP